MWVLSSAAFEAGCHETTILESEGDGLSVDDFLEGAGEYEREASVAGGHGVVEGTAHAEVAFC